VIGNKRRIGQPDAAQLAPNAFAEGAAEVAEAVGLKLVEQPPVVGCLAVGQHLPHRSVHDRQNAMARRLNDQGIRTTSGSGQWSATAVRRAVSRLGA